MKEEDITSTLDVFRQKIQEVAAAQGQVAGEIGTDGAGGASPNDVPLVEIPTFIGKVETALDTELETLKNYITMTVSGDSAISLDYFYDLVVEWSESVWKQRMADKTEGEENNPREVSEQNDLIGEVE